MLLCRPLCSPNRRTPLDEPWVLVPAMVLAWVMLGLGLVSLLDFGVVSLVLIGCISACARRHIIPATAMEELLIMPCVWTKTAELMQIYKSIVLSSATVQTP